LVINVYLIQDARWKKRQELIFVLDSALFFIWKYSANWRCRLYR